MNCKQTYYKLKREVKRNNAIDVSVRYSKGGTNWATGMNEKRGYYFSISPVSLSRENGYTSCSYSAFSGYKTLIREIGRNSKKAYEEAVKFMEENKEMYLRQWFPELETDWEEFE